MRSSDGSVGIGLACGEHRGITTLVHELLAPAFLLAAALVLNCLFASILRLIVSVSILLCGSLLVWACLVAMLYGLLS